MMIIGQRRRLLNYVQRNDVERYRTIIGSSASAARRQHRRRSPCRRHQDAHPAPSSAASGSEVPGPCLGGPGHSGPDTGNWRGAHNTKERPWPTPSASRSHHGDRPHPVVRSRQARPARRRRRRRAHRRHHRARHRHRVAARSARASTSSRSPSTSRSGLRRGQDPRVVLPPRGQCSRPGDPHLPRSPTARCGRASRRGSATRSTSSAPSSPRTRRTPTTCWSSTRASAALMISGDPFDGPIGAVRIAYSTEGTWIPHPTYARGRRLDLRARRRRAGAQRGPRRRDRDHDGRGRRHRARLEYYEDGAPKVTEEVLADGLEAAKTWIRESIELQRDARRKAVAAQASDRSRYDALRRLRRRRLRARRSPSAPPRSPRRTRSRRRPSAMRPSTRRPTRSSTSSQASSTAASGELKRRRPLAHQEARPRAHRRTRASASTAGRPTEHPPAHRRGRPLPDGPRLGPLPARR